MAVYSVLITTASMVFFSALEAKANNYSLIINHGTPIAQQNVSVNNLEVELSKDLLLINHGTSLNGFVGVGQLYSLEHSALLYTSGLDLTYRSEHNIDYAMITAVKYLTSFIFREGSVTTKNFGGHYQFYIAFASSYRINDDWKLGYRISHMSNGYRYDVNPSLDSYNISITYQF